MGKKGKKGTGKKGSKSSSASSTDRKKVEEPKMTIEEARLGFLINVKKRSCEEFEKEREKLKQENECLKEKVGLLISNNRRLKLEQMEYVKDLVAQMKDKDAKVAQAATVARDHVEDAVREKLQAARDSENDIREMKQRIEDVKVETEELRWEVRRREKYKDVGQHEHREQISLFNQTLDDWQKDIEETEKDLKKSLKITHHEITRQAEEKIGMQKHTAAEFATSCLEQNTRKQFIENERLHREIAIHRDSVSQLRSEVEDLEKRNLDMLAEMMEYAGDELAIATQFYMPHIDEENDGELLALTHGGEAESTDEDDSGVSLSGAPLLCVTGKSVMAESKQEKVKPSQTNPGKWPVTARMLQSVLSTP